ncbi:rhamnose mutarotase [Suillus spraguei]|nr:rhamnose mutarotase [Suillus spraguei]
MSTPHTKRICQIIKLKPECAEEYKEVHKNVWPGVLNALGRHHIVDYSINHYPQRYEAIGDDKETQRWWRLTDSMQESFNDGASGSGKEIPWWTDVEEVFRFEGGFST